MLLKLYVYGYLNRCAHMPMELDWREGMFFDAGELGLQRGDAGGGGLQGFRVLGVANTAAARVF